MDPPHVQFHHRFTRLGKWITKIATNVNSCHAYEFFRFGAYEIRNVFVWNPACR